MSQIAAMLAKLDDGGGVIDASPLAAIDPRALLLATIAYLVAVVSQAPYAVAAMAPLALLPAALAAAAGLPWRRLGRRILPALPFALLLGVFNPLIDSEPRLTLFGFAVAGGWLSLTSIMLRAILTVAAALILIDLLGMPRLCAALQQLRTPAPLTTQLLFLHRYLLLVGGELARMQLARQLRAASPRPPPLTHYGPLLGTLLLRCMERARRIDQAMRARGFNGRLPQLTARRWRGGDTLFLAAAVVVIALLRYAAAIIYAASAAVAS